MAAGGVVVVVWPQAVAAGFAAVVMLLMATAAAGFISDETWRAVRRANRVGAPFVGLVAPNVYEMEPVLKSPSFKPSDDIPILDVQGRRFRFGTIGGQRVVMVMTGLSMLNAGLTTQLLLSLFKVKGVVHWGIAGNVDDDDGLQIGDVTIPEYWAHLSLWVWQRHGDGPADELPLEAAGDYTREFGFLNFSEYTVAGHGRGNNKRPDLLAANNSTTLNSIWYQPEEIFPVSGTPEKRQHAFWVPVSKPYYALAEKLESMELPVPCVNATTCLPRASKVTRVPRGCSGNVYVDNAGYRRSVLSQLFQCTPWDMESAAFALVAHQLGVPFIAFRSLSDLAGGGGGSGAMLDKNEIAAFLNIAAQNAVDVMLKFVSLLGAAGEEQAGM